MRLRLRLALTTLSVALPMVAALMAWDLAARTRAAEDELIELVQGLAAAPGFVERCLADPALALRPPSQPPPPPAPSSPAPSPPPPAPSSPAASAPPAPSAPAASAPSASSLPAASAPSASSWGGPPPPARMPGPRVPHSQPAQLFVYSDRGESLQPGAPRVFAAPAGASATGVRRLSTLSGHPWVRVQVPVPGGAPGCALVVAQGTSEPWLGGFLPASPVWLLPLLALLVTVLLAVGPLVVRIRRLTAAVRRSAESEYHVGVAETGRDELGDLGRAFDEAAATVRARLADTQRSETALREFLANTTHDVMIPLTVLQGHLAALKTQLAQVGPDAAAGAPRASIGSLAAAPDPSAADPSPPVDAPLALRQTVIQAMNEAHYVGALLHNLSTVAKLDASDAFVHLADVDLGALVERVVQRHLPVARSLRVSLDRAVPAGPLSVTGDVTLLEQAVGNLVYNAIRYNRPGGHVAVVLEPGSGFPAGDPDSPGPFVLRVLDDGPGIAPADLARLRQRGARGDQARSRAPDGRGLGLHIVARVAELHGLRLQFLPAEGGGLQVELSSSPSIPPREPRPHGPT